MSDREVTATSRVEGRITALGGSFGTRSKAAATIDIQNGAHVYHVMVDGTPRSVIVVVGEDGRFLRTVEDLAASDPLLELPDIPE